MARAVDPASISELAFFNGIEPSEVARLADMLHWRQLPTGSNLMLEEQLGEAVYFILAGTVRIYAAQPDGNEVTLAILGPGAIIGELSLLDGLGRSASASTLEPTSLYWLDRISFVRCVRTMPSVAYNLALILARRLRAADARLRALSSLDVEGRVAHILLGLAREYGIPEPEGAVRIPLRLTQNDLARLVGASRVRINHVVGTLKQRHEITVDCRWHITLHNVAALEMRGQ